MVEAIYEIDVPHGFPAAHVTAEFMARLARDEAVARHQGLEPVRVLMEKLPATGRWRARIFYDDDACPT